MEKIIDFLPHDVVIRDIKDPSIVIASRCVDDSSRLYKFDNFQPSSLTTVLIVHSNENKTWA
jgi:hypothetical protein